MKILIPCITAGAIIGKGGETIAQLQIETNTKVKMSKTNDFYPGKSVVLLKYILILELDNTGIICGIGR